jgi:hypothetical protein
VDALALPPVFLHPQNWKIIQWLTYYPYVIFKWYMTWPFAWGWVNFFFWWLVLDAAFVIWYAYFGGAELMFGPREDDEPK